jgi:hypothetical protein
MFGQGQGQDWQQGSIPSLMGGGAGGQGQDQGQQPYQTAGLNWAGPPGYDQAAALRRHLVQNANTVNLNGDGPVPVPPAPPPAPPAAAPNQFQTGGPELAAALARMRPPAPARPDQFATGGPELAAALANRPRQQGPPGYLNSTGATGGVPAANIGATPATGPLANPAANQRFIGIDRPNAPAEGGPYGRSGLQGTALNLAGLFGGGQPAVNPNAPAANAQPVAAVRPVAGPLAAPPGRTQMTPDQLAAAVSKPNWWQGLGRPDMTPDQLARAIKKPNWYRNV